jgi:hypothetical protein
MRRAILLLAGAALAAAQPAGPFRMPKPMPPEILSGARARGCSPSFAVELENSQLRVTRYRVSAHCTWSLPLDASAPGELLIAMTPLDLLTPSGRLQLDAGEVRWVSAARPWIQNLKRQEAEFLLVRRSQ